MMDADVAVIGLGAMGSSSLWRLASRGASAIGFDQFAPPHDRGSSHGESRIVRTAYFEGAAYVPLAQESFGLWEQLERESGASFLTMTGALTVGFPHSESVSGAINSAHTHHLDHEILTADEVWVRFPQHRVFHGEIGVFEPMAGFLRPERAIAAALQEAEHRGAQIHREVAVQRIEPGDDSVSVVTVARTYKVRHVIVSVGAWLSDFLPDLPVSLKVERQVQAWFPVNDPDLFAPTRCPVFFHELRDAHLCYGFPTLDGREIKVAVHHEGQAAHPNTIDRTISPPDLEPLQQFVGEYLVGVEPVASRSIVCMYTNTLDAHFVVGLLPGVARVTVLGGFSGHGFKFACVLGDIAADLALLGATSRPIEIFSPTRFSPATGAVVSLSQ